MARTKHVSMDFNKRNGCTAARSCIEFFQKANLSLPVTFYIDKEAEIDDRKLSIRI